MAGVLSMVFEYHLAVVVLRQYTQDRRDAVPQPAVSGADGESDLDSDLDEMDEPAWRTYLTFVRRRISEAWRTGRRHMLSLMATLGLLAVLLFVPDLLSILLIPVLFSYWLPQIVHNARRQSTGLRASTIVGMTLTRCYVPLYLFQYKYNLLLIPRSPYVWALIGLSVVQMLVLLGQTRWGPRCFLPHTWRRTEQQWDWHPTPAALAALLQPDLAGTQDPASIDLGVCPICLMPNKEPAAAALPPRQPRWRKSSAPSGIMVSPVCIALLTLVPPYFPHGMPGVVDGH